MFASKLAPKGAIDSSYDRILTQSGQFLAFDPQQFTQDLVGVLAAAVGLAIGAMYYAR